MHVFHSARTISLSSVLAIWACMSLITNAHEGHFHKKGGGAKSSAGQTTVAQLAPAPVQVPKAVDATEPLDNGKPKLETARGIVFEDTNGNGKHDDGEPRLAGIKVSNGEDIVKTATKAVMSFRLPELASRSNTTP